MAKAIKQILYNLLLLFISALVIYIAEGIKYDDWNVFDKIINADLLFVMITSLFTVVFSRSLDNIAAKGFLNYIGLVTAALCFFVYGLALTSTTNFAQILVVLACFLSCIAYVIENIIIIYHHAINT